MVCWHILKIFPSMFISKICLSFLVLSLALKSEFMHTSWSEFWSVSSSTLFQKILRRTVVNSFNGGIHRGSNLVLDFSLLGGICGFFCFHTAALSLLVIGLIRFSLSSWIRLGSLCVSRTCPFHLGICYCTPRNLLNKVWGVQFLQLRSPVILQEPSYVEEGRRIL